MRISELQNEVNHLLFLYFTSVGVIQRDANEPDIREKMKDLVGEIRACKERIRMYMEEDEEDAVLCEDYEEVIAEGKEYIKDGLEFLDAAIRDSAAKM
jgi:hypothetical protein